MLVEIVDDKPDAYELIFAMFPDVDLKLLNTLEQIGRGQLNLKLLLHEAYASRRALSMPPKEQIKLTTGYVPVVVNHDHGIHHVKQKSVFEMTRVEADQVMDLESGCLRNVEQQLDYRRQCDERQAVPDPRIEWDYKHIELVLMRDIRFNLVDLENLRKEAKEKFMPQELASLSEIMKRNQLNKSER